MMIGADFDYRSPARICLAVLLSTAVLYANKLRSKWYDLPHIGMHHCRLKHLMVVLLVAVGLLLAQTQPAMDLLSVEIL